MTLLADCYMHLIKTGIKFCEFHQQLQPKERASAVITFNTDPNVKVILMKTQLAAYGINLYAANYVFFVDPIWDLAQEAQAIKRAHRIGQIREVFIEKLILEGTIDETVNDLISLLEKGGLSTEKDKKIAEERKVHRLLENCSLIPVELDKLEFIEPPVAVPKESPKKNKNMGNGAYVIRKPKKIW